MWIMLTPWARTGVGSNSAAYCSPTLAAMLRANRDDTDETNFAFSEN